MVTHTLTKMMDSLNIVLLSVFSYSKTDVVCAMEYAVFSCKTIPATSPSAGLALNGTTSCSELEVAAAAAVDR